jgi:hypothetical protein
MKNLNIFGSKQLIEEMNLLTVTVINKKITDQMQLLDWEDLSILRSNSNLDAIGMTAQGYIIFKDENGKFYKSAQFALNRILQDEMKKIKPEMDSDKLYQYAQDLVDKLPQLFEK